MEKVQQEAPALRFPAFKQKWTKRALGDLSRSIASGRTKQMVSGTIEVYGSTGVIGWTDEATHDGEYILVARVGANAGLTNRVKGKFAVTDNTLILDLEDEVNATFVEATLHRFNLNKLIFGSGQPLVTGGQLKALKLHFPSLPEQQKIAAFLGAVDRRVRELKRKQELLEQYKKGVVQQLFSQQLRFKRKDGGEFPEWEEKRLGDICSNVAYGMNASAVEFDGVNKYLRITDIDEDSREFLQTGLTSPGNELEDKYLLHEGDLLFARTGASVGKSYLYKKADGKVYFAGFLIRFRIEQGVPEFIYAQTRTKEYDRWVTENSMRSGQPGLNAEEYKSFVIQFPSLEEQSRIAGFLMALDAKVAGVAQAVVAAQRWKKGLLQQMLL